LVEKQHNFKVAVHVLSCVKCVLFDISLLPDELLLLKITENEK